MAFKLSNVVGENFEIYTSEMARMAFKLSTMVGENFEIYTSEMARMAFKLSTIVGKYFGRVRDWKVCKMTFNSFYSL